MLLVQLCLIMLSVPWNPCGHLNQKQENKNQLTPHWDCTLTKTQNMELADLLLRSVGNNGTE